MGTFYIWRRIMKKITAIKLLLLIIIFLFLQSIFVLSAQQDESSAIKKEMKVPTPEFPAL
jgi:uncharacterized membrane protein